MWQCTSRHPEETEALGRLLGGLLGPGDLVALEGPLGAGKTCFARGVLVGLGVTGYLRSPSFTLVHQYRGRLPAYHLDVYRLDRASDMDDLPYEEYFYGEGVTLVEWGRKVKEVLPTELLWVTLLPQGPSTRLITMEPKGERYCRLVEEVSRLAGTGA
ncbi:MAG: tRNA (adenosine(37)-N6)-threonylcarbamoyltransferase complex ATPase subunit type 1 TsaE [Bacillota bacterium]|jgi:tRNA threonylcarbamoyladenosine biosynthesis protein TsaE